MLLQQEVFRTSTSNVSMIDLLPTDTHSKKGLISNGFPRP